MEGETTFPACETAPESVFRSVGEAEVSLDEMLSLACRQGKQDIVELLLESGANVNHRNKAGNTPLLEACSQGHVSIARLLLDRRADIDAPTETTYDSALTWACTLGNSEVVELLLERNAAVEHRTKDGCTALMFAALAGHERVAKLLLDHRAEINVESDSNKDSPLTFACWKGHQRVVELFLRRKADLEHRTKEGFSPLMFAALGGHTQVAELLLKAGAAVNTPSGSNNDIPLTSACWKGHHHVVTLLLQHGSQIEHRTKDGCTPLMLAAREGHLTVAQLLLEEGAMVNVPSGSENNIPLTLACWKGHREVVALLLDHASNIEHQNKAGCTPLMLAAREGHHEATKLLLDSGAQINTPSGSNDDTPLTLACWKGHLRVVRLLQERGSSVNHQTKTGCTPLMEATREGHVGVAELLLEMGADVETPDNYGQSPFFMACWKGHSEVAGLLLEFDANKDCRTKTGITPLFQACRENHVEVVKLLLDYGCNPSTPFPNSRECPITLAAEKGFIELAQLLVSRNANIECRTKKGCTPFFLACREGYTDIAIMLAKHGADTEACDHRGQTALLVAFRSGHVELVDWLLGHVAHLPSEQDCQKALLAPSPPATDLTPQRARCLEMISKAKKAREQAALRNAQSLCEELDAERERQESRKKAAAKRRSRRKERRRKEMAVRQDTAVVAECDNDQALPAEEETPSPPSPPPHRDTTPTSTLAPDITATPSSPTFKQRRSKRKKRRKQQQQRPQPVGRSNGEEEEEDEDDDEEVYDDDGVYGGSGGGKNDGIRGGGGEDESGDDLEYHDAHSELPESSPTREESSGSDPSPSPPTSPSPSLTTRTRHETTKSHEGSVRGHEKATRGHDKATRGGSSEIIKVHDKTTRGETTRGHEKATRGDKRKKITPPTTRDENHTSARDVRKPQTREWAVVAAQGTSHQSGVVDDGMGEERWSSSQESLGEWASDDMELEHLQALSRCSTDDDKIRSQKLMAATETTPHGTTTSTTTTTNSSSLPPPPPHAPVQSSTTTTSPAWHAVTRTTRTLQMTVSNSLVGRVIGRNGSKINRIQEASGAHITVSRNIPKSTERLVTIKGTQHSVSKAQELIMEALSTPDRDGDHLPPSHPSRLRKRQSEMTLTTGTRRSSVTSDTIPPTPHSAPPPISTPHITGHHPSNPSNPSISPSSTNTFVSPTPTSISHTSISHTPIPHVSKPHTASHKVTNTTLPLSTVSESSKYVPTEPVSPVSDVKRLTTPTDLSPTSEVKRSTSPTILTTSVVKRSPIPVKTVIKKSLSSPTKLTEEVKRSTTPTKSVEDSTDNQHEEKEVESCLVLSIPNTPPVLPEVSSVSTPLSAPPTSSRSHRSVAVIQPTQHFPSSVSSSLPSNSSSVPINYPLPPRCVGIIGPPSHRRSSVPSTAFSRPPQRITSYSGHGMQWLPGQQYGIPPMLPGLDSDPEPHPHIPPWSHQHTLPQSFHSYNMLGHGGGGHGSGGHGGGVGSVGSVEGGHKSQNISWSGVQPPPFIPGSSPFIPLTHPPHLSHNNNHHHHHQTPPTHHMMYMPQPSTPDKLHGEPWDFHSPTPGALYGAIGSGLPSNAANQPYSQSSYNVQVSTTHLLPPPPVGLGKPHMHNEVWSRPSSGTTVPSSSSLTFTPPPPPPPPILPVSSSSNNSHLTSPFISKVDHWPALPSTSNGTSRSQAGHSRVDWSVSGCKDVKQGTGDEGRPKVEHEGENEEGEREGEDEGGCGRDLHHLMQSLDIVEHLHVLQDRKLSLSQLISLSDQEWRGLKLPVGPRVKLMNAISNMPKSSTAATDTLTTTVVDSV